MIQSDGVYDLIKSLIMVNITWTITHIEWWIYFHSSSVKFFIFLKKKRKTFIYIVHPCLIPPTVHPLYANYNYLYVNNKYILLSFLFTVYVYIYINFVINVIVNNYVYSQQIEVDSFFIPLYFVPVLSSFLT